MNRLEMKELKDRELAKEIESILEDNRQQTERLNCRLNLQLLECSTEERFVEFAFDVKEWCLNPYDGVHGGAICTLFDTGLGMGAVAITQKMVSTTDISVSFLKPMNGNRYIIRADYTQVGRRMVRCTGKAIDAETGVVCATSMASFVLTEDRKKGLQV